MDTALLLVLLVLLLSGPNVILLSYICSASFMETETGAIQEAQLSPRDRATRLVSSNLANCNATVQKLLIRQVLTKLMV